MLRTLTGHPPSCSSEIERPSEARPSKIPGNTESRPPPGERLGFREEGTLRQLQLVGGRYFDCVSYSMLAADWPAAG
jgi:hypothetical protein